MVQYVTRLLELHNRCCFPLTAHIFIVVIQLRPPCWPHTKLNTDNPKWTSSCHPQLSNNDRNICCPPILGKTLPSHCCHFRRLHAMADDRRAENQQEWSSYCAIYWCVCCVWCCLLWVLWLFATTQQPTGVMGSYTYGRVAPNKENQIHMCLEPSWEFYKVKNTNVNKIDKTYLIICGVLKSVIYGM